MAYLHCHNCNWEQDDFWGKDYNPIRSLLDWKDALLYEDLDKKFTDDAEFLKENGPLTLRDVIAKDLERQAETIRNMKFRTFDDFKQNGKNFPCPKCGKINWDID